MMPDKAIYDGQTLLGDIRMIDAKWKAVDTQGSVLGTYTTEAAAFDAVLAAAGKPVRRIRRTKRPVWCAERQQGSVTTKLAVIVRDGKQ